jgi:hypothetical protein
MGIFLQLEKVLIISEAKDENNTMVENKEI